MTTETIERGAKKEVSPTGDEDRPSPADELARIPLYEKGKPPQPLFDIDYMDELEATWGRRWGAQTELGQLRYVMVQPPTLGQVDTPIIREDPVYFVQPRGVSSFEAMKKNHDSLVRILEAEGIEIAYLDGPETLRGTYIDIIGYDAPREPVILDGGALVLRNAIGAQRGIEKIIAQRLMALGCPILYTVHGKGSGISGGNFVWLDEKHVVIGCSVHTSMEGIEEVEPILRMAGVEEIHIAHLPGYLNLQTERAGGPGGFYHLDMVFGMVDEGLALIHPAGVGYDMIRYLQKRNIELIEVSLEETQNYACNVCPIRPGRIIATAGNHHTREQLEKHGVDVLEMGFEGGNISGRGPACSTLPLIRDKGPSI